MYKFFVSYKVRNYNEGHEYEGCDEVFGNEDDSKYSFNIGIKGAITCNAFWWDLLFNGVLLIIVKKANQEAHSLLIADNFSDKQIMIFKSHQLHLILGFWFSSVRALAIHCSYI